MFAIVGIVFNSRSGHADEWAKNGSNSSVNSLTLGSYGIYSARYDDKELIIQAYLNFGVIVIVLLLSTLFRRRQLKIERSIDEKNITPADYTVFVMNLPLNKNKAEVAEWFKEYDPSYKLTTINYCYNIHDIVKK